MLINAALENAFFTKWETKMKHEYENVTVSFIMDAVNSQAIEFNFGIHSKHKVINVKTGRKFHKIF